MLDSYIELYESVKHNKRPQYLFKSGDFPFLSGIAGGFVRLVNVRNSIDEIPHDEKMYEFFHEVKKFWMIPCQSPKGTIIGFVLKGVEQKAYRVVSNYSPLLYGLLDFEPLTYDDPIILTEGVRDALYIKQFYPYTVALLTSSISQACLEFLQPLSLRFIIAFDRDSAGIQGTQKATKALQEKKKIVGELKPMFKDWGESFKYPNLFPTNKKNIDTAINNIRRTR